MDKEPPRDLDNDPPSDLSCGVALTACFFGPVLLVAGAMLIGFVCQ